MLVLDGDTGVVNPNHCVEEWIDDRVNIIWYDRFWNFEVMAGSYLVKNSEYSKKFLLGLADYEWKMPKSKFPNYDNGALHIHLLKTLVPSAKADHKACQAKWNVTEVPNYWEYVTCVRYMLGGSNRLWPGKMRFFRRGHGFARDGWITDNRWSDADFMFHDQEWKRSSKMFDISECGQGYAGWHWKSGWKISIEEEKKKLADFERNMKEKFPKEARGLIYLTQPEIGECFPNCDDDI